MDEHANGIVLNSHRYSETSLILRWLTLEHGRLDTLARGARRPKSPFRGKLDLFYLAEFTFTRSRRSELHSLREVRLRETFSPLRLDLSRLQQAAYASALIAQTTEPGLPLPEIFKLLAAFLEHLSQHPPSPMSALAFELKLLAALGLQPNPAELPLTPSLRRAAESCLALDWPQIRIPPARDLLELSVALHRFLQFHLGRIPAQRARILGPGLI